ncbi:hypothetical protein [Candidatus Leptofilum sp.]
MKRPTSTQEFNQFGQGMLPGYLGIEIALATPDKVICHLPVRIKQL